ncbi:Imm72 family immunity protein [Enterobacter chuandaensis]|uniref:Imm72 family immunity protein n=1 Tax=Enterobacter chuandaensis TaxID=2497875 RepID=A0AA96RVF6_9ENTR|nr:Imm72 family immunity protein [Enterobacter chuandaensis]MCW4781365.1 Imm72 family immunity protein [Enterobacter chuandaensis]MDA4759217.1 Imm72 family immunity protein [Enterobacter chuandaensis]WNS39564.1 Imm72 family immunity protein [Enterobacter chuandaensis]
MITIEKTKYPMSDDLVRRKLFWLLQRLSSYSLWQRKRDAWAYFTQQYEWALKTWPEEITKGFYSKGIIRAYEVLRLYEEGLSELAVGNRQVWQRQTGAFHQLFRPMNLIRTYFYYPCHNERGGQEEDYPPEIEILNKLKIAAEFKGDNLLYPPHDNVCNIFNAEYLLNTENYHHHFRALPYPVFPKNLPPVPERSDIIIKTDDSVPCDGIWEPVKIHYNHKLLIIKNGISGFKNLGAYNYFIRGMNAPRQVYYDVLIESDTEMVIPDDPIRYRDVHWRLVWEDTRYCDGIIPDESEYFLDNAPGKRITCPSGELCPHSGYWATIAGGHQQFIDVQAGQLMPEATKYQSNMYADEIHLPAIWSLLHRDDEGSVCIKTGDS